ncbi:MAG: hypothetical protein ABH873_09410 [Candidatus Firestonebacteria bacterium]
MKRKVMEGKMSKNLTEYRFSFGPWNIHAGADPFGPKEQLMVQ